jgi:acylphosphatase
LSGGERPVKMNTRVHVFVRGTVQGVFFRSETRNEAKKRNVRGWVRNLPDGSVEALFEGEATNVKALVKFCGHGPKDAIVTDTEVWWEDYKGEFDRFEMRY